MARIRLVGGARSQLVTGVTIAVLGLGASGCAPAPLSPTESNVSQKRTLHAAEDEALFAPSTTRIFDLQQIIIESTTASLGSTERAAVASASGSLRYSERMITSLEINGTTPSGERLRLSLNEPVVLKSIQDRGASSDRHTGSPGVHARFRSPFVKASGHLEAGSLAKDVELWLHPELSRDTMTIHAEIGLPYEFPIEQSHSDWLEFTLVFTADSPTPSSVDE